MRLVATGNELRLFIDGVIGAIAVGALLWTLSVRDLTAQLGERAALGTVCRLGIRVAGCSRTCRADDRLGSTQHLPLRSRLVLIGLAVIAHGSPTTPFLTSGVGRSFADAEPLYPVSIFAVTMLSLPELHGERKPQKYEYAYRTRTPWWVLDPSRTALRWRWSS